MKERQEFIRKWLMDAMGGFPNKTPLNARVTGGFSGTAVVSNMQALSKDPPPESRKSGTKFAASTADGP